MSRRFQFSLRNLLGLTATVAVMLALLTLALRHPRYGLILGCLTFAVGGIGGELLSGRFRSGVIMSIAACALFYIIASNSRLTLFP